MKLFKFTICCLGYFSGIVAVAFFIFIFLNINFTDKDYVCLEEKIEAVAFIELIVVMLGFSILIYLFGDFIKRVAIENKRLAPT